jgi:iron complex outermembrane recepter protein
MVRRQALHGEPDAHRSGRYTDVDSYGSGDTYKVGLNWQINDSWRVRASQGTSFRTPALFELYLADQTSFLGQRSIDPCINWGDALANNRGDLAACRRTTAPATAWRRTTGGDLGDRSSRVAARGAGGGDLRVADRRHRLDVRSSPSCRCPSITSTSRSDDEVGQLARQIVFGCYNSLFFPNEPLCDLFERAPAGRRASTTSATASSTSTTQKNEGFDLSAVWRTRSASWAY